MASPTPPPIDERIRVALDTVVDPELDEPITELGFIAAGTVRDGAAMVRLRLPTYFCAANFAFLIVADAHRALLAAEGIHRARVVLEDHFAAVQINAAVDQGRTFVQAFGDEAEAELDSLRREFQRRAVLAATERVGAALLRRGVPREEMAALTLGQIADVDGVARLRDRRVRLGLTAADEDAFLVDPVSGAPLRPEEAIQYLRRARLTLVSMESNGELCRGLLRQRYDEQAVAVRVGTPASVPVDAGR